MSAEVPASENWRRAKDMFLGCDSFLISSMAFFQLHHHFGVLSKRHVFEKHSNMKPMQRRQLVKCEQKGCRKQGGLAKRWEDDTNASPQTTEVTVDDRDLTNDTTWLSTRPDVSKWDSMESYFVSSILKQRRRPNQQHSNKQRTRLKSTINNNKAINQLNGNQCSGDALR